MDFEIMTPTEVTYKQTPCDASKGLIVGDAMVKTGNAFSMKDLAPMGFTADEKALRNLAQTNDFREFAQQYANDAGFSFDADNIDALGQFFMLWNEQTIDRLYRGRTAAATFGVKTMGDWLTERIVFKLRTLRTGGTGLYDDFARPQYVNANYGYDYRDTVRIEWGLEVTNREEQVASVMRRNAYKDKKDAIVLTQDIWENGFFWNGLSLGGKKLYGVLSDVNLPATSSLPVDFGSASVTPTQVIGALRAMKQQMATTLQGNGDIDKLDIQIACPIKWQTAFTAVDANTVVGYTANTWLEQNWKNATVSFKPELDTADAGDPMMIVFATNVPGVGMDTINLARTSALRLVGAIPTLTGRMEAYSSSVAGALVACPMGVQLWTAPGK